MAFVPAQNKFCANSCSYFYLTVNSCRGRITAMCEDATCDSQVYTNSLCRHIDALCEDDACWREFCKKVCHPMNWGEVATIICILLYCLMMPCRQISRELHVMGWHTVNGCRGLINAMCEDDACDSEVCCGLQDTVDVAALTFRQRNRTVGCWDAWSAVSSLRQHGPNFPASDRFWRRRKSFVAGLFDSTQEKLSEKGYANKYAHWPCHNATKCLCSCGKLNFMLHVLLWQPATYTRSVLLQPGTSPLRPCGSSFAVLTTSSRTSLSLIVARYFSVPVSSSRLWP